MSGAHSFQTEAATGSSALPLAPYDTPWDGPEAEQAIFAWATPKGEKQFSPAKAKQCFLFCDTSKPELRASYKLPFCRIAGGKPQIVPKAVFTIAGVLNGAMGGLKGVSDADAATIQRKVTALYHRIAAANPKQQVKPPFGKTGESMLNPTPAPRDPVLAQQPGSFVAEPAFDAHRDVHDHVAAVLDVCLEPIHGGAQERATSGLSEAHIRRLAAVHDEAARQHGMTCECGYDSSAPTQPPLDARLAHHVAHDHLAHVLDAHLHAAHGLGDDTAPAQTLEAAHARHLVAAHDAAAQSAGLPCAGCYANSMHRATPDDPRFAQGNDDMQSARGNAPLLLEAQRLLAQAGWQIQRPKTEAEKLQEHIAAQITAMQEAHTREMAELRAQMPSTGTSQPAAHAAGNATTQQSHPNSIRGSLYSHGKYLRERLTTLDWVQLADRTAPLPEDLQLDWLLKEFEQLYAVQYDDRFHVLSAQDAELR